MPRKKITKIVIYIDNATDASKTLEGKELNNYCALFWENHHPDRQIGSDDFAVKQILGLYYQTKVDAGKPVTFDDSSPYVQKIKAHLNRTDTNSLTFDQQLIQDIWDKQRPPENNQVSYILKVGVSPFEAVMGMVASDQPTAIESIDSDLINSVVASGGLIL